MANPTNEQLKNDCTRAISVTPSSWNEAAYSVDIVFSTGARVMKYDWANEMPYFEEMPLDRMDLSDLNNGAPVLRSHDTAVEAVIGHVENGTARVVGEEARATVILSKEPGDADVVNKIRDGHLRKWSFGYEKIGRPDIAYDEQTGIEIRTWQSYKPYEVSTVAVPADAGTYTRAKETSAAAVGSVTSKKENKMDEHAVVTQVAVTETADLDAVRAKAAQDERERITGIRSAGKKLGVAENEVESLLSAGVSLVDAREKLIDLAAARDAAAPTHNQVTVVRDAGEVRMKAVGEALEAKAGLRTMKDLSEAAREFRGASLVDLAAETLNTHGVRTRGMSRGEIIDRATRAPAGHTSADFPSLLANVGAKALQMAFELPSEYRWFERIGVREDFADYKAKKYPNLLGFGTLPTVLEGGEYQGVTGADVGETLTPVKKGGELRVTKEMLANDDLSSFVRVAREFGLAAIRTASGICLTAVTSQTMGDGDALYHANHSNLGTGGAVTVDTLAELDQLLRDQEDGNGAAVGMPGKFILAPNTLRKSIEQLFSDRVLVTDPTDALIVGIPSENRIYVPGLSGTAYYMLNGDPGAFVYGYLAEEGGPVVSQYPDFNTDSMIFHATMTFGACSLKWQAFAKNAGV